MTVSPFTLNNLYGQGIIDYVPYDLGVSQIPMMNGMQNPYMQNAMQGALYQKHGTMPDAFTHSAGLNGFGVQGIGETSSAGLNGFGESEIGKKTSAGINGFGGGFGNLGKDFSNGVEKTVSFIDRIPTFVKGLISGAIAVGAVAYCLKGKKKPPEPKSGFWSKMNPINWFKHKNK